MSSPLRPDPRLPAMVRVILAMAARLVPRRRRRVWRKEWEAELVFTLRREGVPRRAVGRRALLAIADAFWLRVRLGSTPLGTDPEPSRNGWTIMWDDLLRDVRISARSLRTQPRFAGLAIATVGLGIGAATAIFGLVNGVLLRPLAYPEPDRLVSVWPEHWFSGFLFERLEEETDSYVALAAWRPRSYTELEDVGARLVHASRATGDFFRVLGSDAAVGRTFAPDEDRPGSPGGVVLSHELWMRRFGGDSTAIGTNIRLSHPEVPGGVVPIVGVMPPGFSFEPGRFGEPVEPADLALTVPLDPSARRYRTSEFKVIGRLRPGVTRQQASAELDAVVAGWRERFDQPTTFGDDATILPLKELVVADSRPTVLLLFGAVVLILVIALINVGNLLLARALARHREVSVRQALGATWGRLLRHVLVESTLLSLLGSVLGLALAAVGVRGLRALLAPSTPRLEAVNVDGTVAVFCVALALVTGWAVGLVTALRPRTADLRSALGGESRGTTGGRRRHLFRSGLLASEVALGVVLLTASGGLANSFWHVTRQDTGFRPRGLLSLHVAPLSGRLESWGATEQYYGEIAERLNAIPGVAGVAAVSQAPVTGDGGVVSYHPADRPPEQGEEPGRVRWRAVGTDYFGTAGIDVVAGRVFDASDREGAEPVAVLSEEAASELYPGGDAIGGRVITGFESQEVTIVGVVRDIRLLGPAEPSLPMIYRPFPQTASVFESYGWTSREFVIRTAIAAASLAGPVRDAIAEVDPRALVSRFEPVSDAIAGTLSGRRTTLILLAFFATSALALGSVGIYGVTGYLVRERRRELGVRIAIGASGRRVIGEVLAGILKLAGAGAVVGAGVALAASRLLRAFLVEASVIDPWVYAAAVLLSVGLALAAATIPARSAGRTDPIEVLSAEG